MTPQYILDTLLKLESYYSRKKICELLNVSLTTLDRWLYLETMPPKNKKEDFENALDHLKNDFINRALPYSGFTYYHKVSADLEKQWTEVLPTRIDSSLERAQKLILQLIPCSSKEIMNEARRLNISRAHMYKASALLDVQMTETGRGRNKKSYWSL